MKTILETLAEEGRFQTLLSVLSEADLLARLEGPGPFTLFAPDDNAFQRVNLDEIRKDKSDFDATMKYHLLTGKLMSSELTKSESLYTESGKSLTVHLEEGKSVVDNGNLVKTDIECSNGVIHVIDNVFLPKFSGWYCGCC